MCSVQIFDNTGPLYLLSFSPTWIKFSFQTIAFHLSLLLLCSFYLEFHPFSHLSLCLAGLLKLQNLPWMSPLWNLGQVNLALQHGSLMIILLFLFLNKFHLLAVGDCFISVVKMHCRKPWLAEWNVLLCCCIKLWYIMC